MIEIMELLDKETQKKLIEFLYYKAFLEFINDNKM